MRRQPSIVGPLILITIGMLALLANMGYLTASFWLTAIQFWPFILILIGLEILIGRQSWLGTFVVLIIGLVMVGAIVYVATNPEALSLGAASTTETITQPLGSIRSATISISPGLGELKLTALGSDSDNLIDAAIRHPGNIRIDKNYQEAGGQAQLKLEQRGTYVFMGNSLAHWEVGLVPQVPLTLNIDAGVGSADVDLNALNVTALRINAGVGTVQVTLPSHAGTVTARVDGGVGSLSILVPQGVPARIRTTSGIGGVSVNPARFPRTGNNQYASADYGAAANKIDLDVNTGVGGISIP